jgi:hypothetical protein
MQVSTIQGQTLAAPINIEGALLELLQIAEGFTTPDSPGQASTTFSDDSMNATISLPINYGTNSVDGTVIVTAVGGSFDQGT